MSAAEIAEQLRIEQIPADIARTTQELLYEPRKYRVQFAGGDHQRLRRGWCRWRRCCRGLHQRASSGTATNRNSIMARRLATESNRLVATRRKTRCLAADCFRAFLERNLC